MAPLFDRFRGGSGPALSHYELKVKSPRGGMISPKKNFENFETELTDIDDLDEPLEEAMVRNTAESEGWPSGVYYLEAKATNGSVMGYEWKFEHEGDGPEELTETEKMRREIQQLRAEMQDGGGRISSPDDAYGEVFRRALEGEITDETNMVQLRKFLDEWQSVTAGTPSSPSEMAGRIMSDMMRTGDRDAATGILGQWFAAESTASGNGKQSLLEQASSSDLDIDMGDVKTLAYLQFLDNPRKFTKDLSGGLLDSAREVDSGAGFEDIAAALAGGGQSDPAPASDPAPQASPEPGAAPPAPEPAPEPPAHDPEPTGADVGVIGADKDEAAEDTAEDTAVRRPQAGEVYDGPEAMETMVEASERGDDPMTAVGTDLDPVAERDPTAFADGDGGAETEDDDAAVDGDGEGDEGVEASP